MPLIQWVLQNIDAAADTNIGGVVCGGDATHHRILCPRTSGGAICGGTAVHSVYDIASGNGGAVCGGSVGTIHVYDEFCSGGLVCNGTVLPGKLYTEVASSGVVCGGRVLFTVSEHHVSGGVSVGSGFGAAGAIVSVDFEAALPPSNKPELPRHPKYSTANYNSGNVATLIEFFAPIVGAVTGLPQTNTSIMFRYENNTPGRRRDDIKVKHPDAIGVPYTPPKNLEKSEAMMRYEAAAKKSKRLQDFQRSSPAGVRYFKDIDTVGKSK
jgi:hypothetical protein